MTGHHIFYQVLVCLLQDTKHLIFEYTLH